MNNSKRGKSNRRKGYMGEYNVINFLNENLSNDGIETERTAHPGVPGDALIKGFGKVEVKNRESISNKLWEWIDNVPFVALKKNRKKYLILMDIDTFVQLLKDAKNGK